MEQINDLGVACPVCDVPVGELCRWPDSHAHLRGRSHNGRLDNMVRASMTRRDPVSE